METISNSIENGLINGLSYKLDATASYITDRKSCTFYAMGGNAYAPNSGTKVIKLVLNSESWLDPSTIKIQFDVQNLSNAPLRALSGGWSYIRKIKMSRRWRRFRRYRSLCAYTSNIRCTAIRACLQ